MPNDIATYVIADREGVRLHAELDAATLEKVASFQERLRAREQETTSATGNSKTPTRRTTGHGPIKVLQLGQIKIPANALSQQHVADATRMADVYPLLYVFENSMREFVDGHLTAVYGGDWPEDPKIVNTTVKGRVERNRNAETRHRYHSRRTARFVHYTDLGDLPLIVHSENGWKVFKPLFPSDKWLHARVEVIEASRNVVAHMNPLQKRDIDRIRLNFEDWLDQIKDHLPDTGPR